MNDKERGDLIELSKNLLSENKALQARVWELEIDAQNSLKEFKQVCAENAELILRVKELESGPSPVLDLLGKFKEENARLRESFEKESKALNEENQRMRKVVEAAREAVGPSGSMVKMSRLQEALRELGGEKK